MFNICEGLKGVSREAQVPALLEAYDIPYVFSDPLTLALTLDKAMTKRVVRDAGVPTADFAVIESEADIAKVALPFPLFLKPVAEGSGKGVDARSRVDRSRPSWTAWRAICWPASASPCWWRNSCPAANSPWASPAPATSASVLGVSEIVPTEKYVGHGYGYREQGGLGRQARHRAGRRRGGATRRAQVALAAWRVLRCRDGGRADIRLDADGKPRFIEVNPLAGIRPGYSDLCFIADFQKLSYQRADRQIPGLLPGAAPAI